MPSSNQKQQTNSTNYAIPVLYDLSLFYVHKNYINTKKKKTNRRMCGPRLARALEFG